MAAITTPATPMIPALDAILQRLLIDRPTNADRLYRAVELVQRGHVERTAEPFLFLVYSQSTPDGCYHVRRGACNCPDATRRDVFYCKHAEAVAMFVQLERAEAEAGLDADAPITLELTDAAYTALAALGEPCDVPALCPECGAVGLPTHVDHLCRACLCRELCGPEDPAA